MLDQTKKVLFQVLLARKKIYSRCCKFSYVNLTRVESFWEKFSAMAGISKFQEHTAWDVKDVILLLLPFISLRDTVSLAKAQPKVESVLKDVGTWRKLVQRNSPLNEEKISQLAILLERLKSPAKLLHIVLADICETNQSTAEVASNVAGQLGTEPVSVTLLGFQLLEQVEFSTGTTVMSVQLIDVKHQHIPLPGQSGKKTGLSNVSRQFMSAVRSRTSRQQIGLTTVKIGSVQIRNLSDLTQFKALITDFGSSAVQIDKLLVISSIGQTGWETLAGVVKKQPGLLNNVAICDAAVEGLKKAEAKILWNNMVHDGNILFGKNMADMVEYKKRRGSDELKLFLFDVRVVNMQRKAALVRKRWLMEREDAQKRFREELAQSK